MLEILKKMNPLYVDQDKPKSPKKVQDMELFYENENVVKATELNKKQSPFRESITS